MLQLVFKNGIQIQGKLSEVLSQLKELESEHPKVADLIKSKIRDI